MNVILLRHGLTQGNLERRYIGCRTDEPLCEAGRAALAGLVLPPVGRVYTSPMKRCLETAALLYPDAAPIPVEDFREIDFGDFEGGSYQTLNGRADYQAWIDSGGELPFPGGESKAAFCARCVRAFEAIWQREAADFAVIAHGGTVMAIMEAFARPKGSYYDYQLKNGEGFRLEKDGHYEKLPAPAGQRG